MRKAAATSATVDWNPSLGAAPVVWERGRSVSGRALLAAAQQLADRLPEAGHVLNVCTARTTFIVGFLAALVRRHKTILATDRSERAIRQLRRLYPTLYCLTDGDGPAGLPMLSLAPPADGANGGYADTLSVSLAPDQVAVTAFTSGSTGTPIAHPKTVATLAASARMIAQQLGLQGSRSTLVTTVPPQHMYGLEMSVLLPLWADVAVHSARPLYPADVAAALQEVPGPRHLVTTPVHLRALVESTVTLPEMESIVSASAPLPEAVAARAEKVFATKVVDL